MSTKQLATPFGQIQQRLNQIILKTEEGQPDSAPQKHQMPRKHLESGSSKERARRQEKERRIRKINAETKEQLEQIKKQRILDQMGKIEGIASAQRDMNGFVQRLEGMKGQGGKKKGVNEFNRFTQQDLNLIRNGKNIRQLKNYTFDPQEMQLKQRQLEEFLQEDEMQDVLFDFQKLLNPEEDLLAKQDVQDHDDEVEIQNYTYLPNSTLNKIIKINNEIKHHMLQLEHEKKMKKIQDIQYIQNQQIFGSIAETPPVHETPKQPQPKRLSIHKQRSSSTQMRSSDENMNDFNSYFQQPVRDKAYDNQRQCRQHNPSYSQQPRLVRRIPLQPFQGQHFTIEQHQTIDPDHLQRFPLQKDQHNNEVTRKLILQQFYSNMLYKKNIVEHDQIKVLANNEPSVTRVYQTAPICVQPPRRTPPDTAIDDSETTVSNKPKYLSKLNIYKGKKLRHNPSQESLQPSPLKVPSRRNEKHYLRPQNVIDNRRIDRNATQPILDEKIVPPGKQSLFFKATTLQQTRKKQEDIPQRFLKNSQRNLESISCQEFWKNNF